MHAWLVDAFADRQYAGNPAAVVVRPDGFDTTERMQAAAAAFGLPTTAFVVPVAPGEFLIRWFTPKAELNICGHATVASACYLYEAAGGDAGELSFRGPHDVLYTSRRDGLISIALPRIDVVPVDPPPGLIEALGTPVERCALSPDDLLVEVGSEEAVAALRPDFARLAEFDVRGHVVTAASNRPGVDFVSRAFFPALGVDEDQVCVSAHCKLAPYWSGRLDRRRLSALQLSTRGGRLLVETADDHVRVAGAGIVRGRLPVGPRDLRRV
ncbi:PhzF family phenazine biosynthesis protein [Parafrankia sp. FMc6]|uniref:PhzF family phenazine biosynthesis protein n=1 Tax=Parafrankia soli TaxID=2599596 RepID=UPI0034D64348